MSLDRTASVRRAHVEILEGVVSAEIYVVVQRQPRLLGMGAVLNAEDDIQNLQRLESVFPGLVADDLPGGGNRQEVGCRRVTAFLQGHRHGQTR